MPLVNYSDGIENQITNTKDKARLPLSYKVLSKIIKDFLFQNGLFDEYKIHYLDCFLTHIKASTHQYFRGYDQFVEEMSSLLPPISFVELKALQNLRKDRINQLLFSYSLLKGFPKAAMKARTFLMDAKNFNNR